MDSHKVLIYQNWFITLCELISKVGRHQLLSIIRASMQKYFSFSVFFLLLLLCLLAIFCIAQTVIFCDDVNRFASVGKIFSFFLNFLDLDAIGEMNLFSFRLKLKFTELHSRSMSTGFSENLFCFFVGLILFTTWDFFEWTKRVQDTRVYQQNWDSKTQTFPLKLFYFVTAVKTVLKVEDNFRWQTLFK